MGLEDVVRGKEAHIETWSTLPMDREPELRAPPRAAPTGMGWKLRLKDENRLGVGGIDVRARLFLRLFP